MVAKRRERLFDPIISQTSAVWVDTRSKRGTIEELITAIGATVCTLLVNTAESFADDDTIPSTMSLKFTPNGSFAIAATKNLDIQTTNIEAGSHQIFSGAGDFDFADGTVLKTSWFSTFSAGLTYIGPTDLVTYKVTEDHTITATDEVTSNIILDVTSNNILSDDANNATLTISGGLIAGNTQFLDWGTGSGSVTYLDGTIVKSVWHGSFIEAVADITSTSDVTLEISSSETISATLSVGTNFELKFPFGVILSDDANNATLTINGSIIATPDQQIFSWGNGSGSVILSPSLRIPSVKWAGATGDGTTDDLASISLFIADDMTLFFPPGVYAIYDTLTITANQVKLIGEKTATTIISNRAADVTKDTIVFTMVDPGVAYSLNSGSGIENILITTTNTKTAGAALKLIKQNNFKLNKITTLNHPFGFDLHGVTSATMTEFSLFGKSGGSLVDESALFRIQSWTNDDTSLTCCWTSSLDNFVISGNSAVDYGMLIHDSDGLKISNGYIASTFDSLVSLDPDTGEIAGQLKFVNIYFDGVAKTTGTLYAVSDGTLGANALDSILFTNCTFSNLKERGVWINNNNVGTVTFNGNGFREINNEAIKINSTNGNFLISNNQFRNCRASGGGGDVIGLDNSKSVTITGNKLYNTSAVAAVGINWAGTHYHGIVIGNSFRNFTTDDIAGETTATFTHGYTQVSNITDIAAAIPDYIGLNRIVLGNPTGPRIIPGSGSPEGVFTAPIGSIFLRIDGGASTSFYVKESGTGNTGWVAK